jgi:C-terminal peptidase prc
VGPEPTPTKITSTQTPLPSAVPTQILTATPTATPRPTTSPTHLETFEELWDIINTEYLYPDFNGLDWDAVYAEYLAEIEAGLSDEQFYAVMSEMVRALGDDHSFFLSPRRAAEEEAQFNGDNNYVGLGVLLSTVPERDRAIVLLTFGNSPAAEAGLQPRDSILSIDGQPILNEHGYLSDLLLGPQGSSSVLVVQSPGEDPRQVTVTRRIISGSLPVSHTILVTPERKRVGYILLVSFADSNIDDQVGAILAAFGDEGIEGLIIDNRMNEGGADSVLTGMLSYFTEGTLGFFVNREGRYPLRIPKPRNINNSIEIPLVVLIGKNTFSYGEVFAGVLKDTQRAYLIGERTDGNIETLWGFNFKDGSRAWIAHDTFQPINNPNHDWEHTGVLPDLTVPVHWEDYPLENDPAVLAALNYLDYR